MTAVTEKAAVLEDPISYHDELSWDDREKWEEACRSELETFKRMEVFEEVKKPNDRKIIGCKWVFRYKLGLNGQIKKYKACLVVQGFSGEETKRSQNNWLQWVFRYKLGLNGQIKKYKARLVVQSFSHVKEIDYNETFAPVTKFNSIQLLLALSAHFDWEIHQMDVKSAFLNGELNKKMYMQVLPGYKAAPRTVWRLKKALYGLKQASQEWYKRLSKELSSLGFTQIQSDHCVFYKKVNGHHLIIPVYVDNNLIILSSTDLVIQTKKDLSSHFEMTDLGEIHWILNMEVIWDQKNRTISLCQSQYIENIMGWPTVNQLQHQWKSILSSKNLKWLKLTPLHTNNSSDH